MSKTDLQRKALELPEPERLALAAGLWARVEDPNAFTEGIELPQWQKDLIDERLESRKDVPGEDLTGFVTQRLLLSAENPGTQLHLASGEAG
jgi:hypothetical protein